MDTMNEGSPPPAGLPSAGPPPRRGTLAAILGGVVGLLIAAAGSFLLVMSTLGYTIDNGGGSRNCPGYFPGVVAVVIAVALGIAAWYLTVKVRPTGFGLNFLRGLLVAVAVFELAPWPCSLTAAAYFIFACR